MENISGFFVVFKEVEQWQITINIARRDRYKIFTTKIFSKERTVIKTTLEIFQSSFVLLRRNRCFFDGHKLPARANGTKREAVWYSSHTYHFSVGMRTIQKGKGSRKKTKYFCGKRSCNGEYRQQQKRLTKSKVCGDEVSYTFLEKVLKRSPRRWWIYVVFSMSYGKI